MGLEQAENVRNIILPFTCAWRRHTMPFLQDNHSFLVDVVVVNLYDVDDMTWMLKEAPLWKYTWLSFGSCFWLSVWKSRARESIDDAFTIYCLHIEMPIVYENRKTRAICWKTLSETSTHSVCVYCVYRTFFVAFGQNIYDDQHVRDGLRMTRRLYIVTTWCFKGGKLFEYCGFGWVLCDTSEIKNPFGA